MLIERDNELQCMHRALSLVPGHGGQILLVYGDAGIGKTSLVREFLNRLGEDEMVALGMCDPLSTPRPMGPVHDIARAIFAGNSHDGNSLTEGLVDKLACADRTHVLLLEDMHWADQASLDWLKYVGRRITLIPVLLIITFRDVDVDAAHPLRSALGVIPSDRTQRMPLSPLSAEGISEFELPPQMSAKNLHQITQGNPFFVTEILGSSAELGTVPESVKDAVNARINQLSPEIRTVVETAALFPGDINPDFLARVIGRPVKDELAVAERLQFITVGTNGYRFRHELARLAAQSRLSETDRQSIHHRILDTLLAQNDVAPLLADIVHHSEGAGDIETLLRFAPMAAKDAAAVGAHREAAQYLFAAMNHVDQAEPAAAAEIYEMWAYEAGLALAVDDSVIDARQKAVALWKELKNPDRVGENLRWLSRLHWYRGEPETAQTYLEEAIDILQKAPSEATAKAFSLRSQFCMLRDEMKAAQEWGKKALEIAGSVGAQEVVAHALNTIGTAKLFRGDLEGEELLRESLAVSLEHGFHEQAARAYTNLSECLIELRELDKAEPLLDEGITFDMAHDLDAWTWYLVGRKAQLRFEQDRYFETVDLAKGVLGQKNQTILMQLPAKIMLARSLLRLGDADAHDRLNEALSDALQIGELQYVAVMRTAFAEAAVLWGQPDFAQEHIKEMLTIPHGSLSPRKWNEFMFWADRLEIGSSEDHQHLLSGPFKLDSERRYEDAAETFRETGSLFLAATSLCGRETIEALKTADGWYDDISGLAGRRYIRETFKENTALLPGLSRGKYEAARRHPYGLTGKEQIVLQHLVNGASNARIADEMSRSKRTIENHVSSIFSKYGVSNRVELVLRAQAEAWTLN